jgi:DNA-binding transcriptional MerR regulator
VDSAVAIPNRAVFRAQEVCDIAQVQPYVLRSWEAEFPDLGVAKSSGAARVYRRADVERVLRIKHLLFVDGLTLAGARKRLGDEGLLRTEAPAVEDADVAALVDEETRQHLRDVRRGLQWILGVLSDQGVTPEDRVLVAAPASRASAPRPSPASAKKAMPRAKKGTKPRRGR